MKIVELPCVVGDEVWILDDGECIPGTVSMLTQKSDRTWHFRITYKKLMSRAPHVPNPRYSLETYQMNCSLDSLGTTWFLPKI